MVPAPIRQSAPAHASTCQVSSATCWQVFSLPGRLCPKSYPRSNSSRTVPACTNRLCPAVAIRRVQRSLPRYRQNCPLRWQSRSCGQGKRQAGTSSRVMPEVIDGYQRPVYRMGATSTVALTERKDIPLGALPLCYQGGGHSTQCYQRQAQGSDEASKQRSRRVRRCGGRETGAPGCMVGRTVWQSP